MHFYVLLLFILNNNDNKHFFDFNFVKSPITFRMSYFLVTSDFQLIHVHVLCQH